MLESTYTDLSEEFERWQALCKLSDNPIERAEANLISSVIQLVRGEFFWQSEEFGLERAVEEREMSKRLVHGCVRDAAAQILQHY